jgi:hypothetical protein
MERNMMRFNALVGIILFFFTFSVLPTTINGRFIVLEEDSSKFTVLLQINTNTGTDDLGGSTIVFNFDTTAISFTSNPVKDVDYVFHNFCSGNYSPATVTRPMQDKIWVNIDLPFNNNNNGTVVAASPGWTDVVTIYFNIIDPSGMAHLSWLTASPFWGIYDADNSTLLQTGEFTDLFGPVPVELISFTGTLLSNNYVLLEWKTASSLNNYGFEIERASSIATPVQGWEIIGFVENQGDPNSLVEYSFTDITLHSFNVVRYRLKSIDNDGTFQYSDEIEVNTSPLNYELDQNYPNPFNPSTTIKFAVTKESNVNLSVYNALGELVSTLVNEQLKSGYHQYEFDASNLASGVYIYRIIAGDFVETKKMVLLQ